MNFLQTLDAIISNPIETSPVLSVERSDLELIEDLAIQAGYARSAKESYEDHIKDSMDPMLSASERTEQRKWAEDSRKEYQSAQLMLIELTARLKVKA